MISCCTFRDRDHGVDRRGGCGVLGGVSLIWATPFWEIGLSIRADSLRWIDLGLFEPHADLVE